MNTDHHPPILSNCTDFRCKKIRYAKNTNSVLLEVSSEQCLGKPWSSSSWRRPSHRFPEVNEKFRLAPWRDLNPDINYSIFPPLLWANGSGNYSPNGIEPQSLLGILDRFRRSQSKLETGWLALHCRSAYNGLVTSNAFPTTWQLDTASRLLGHKTRVVNKLDALFWIYGVRLTVEGGTYEEATDTL